MTCGDYNCPACNYRRGFSDGLAQKNNDLEKEIAKLKETVLKQEQVIEMLSNKKIAKGLISALEDVKKGRYIVLSCPSKARSSENTSKEKKGVAK